MELITTPVIELINRGSYPKAKIDIVLACEQGQVRSSFLHGSKKREVRNWRKNKITKDEFIEFLHMSFSEIWIKVSNIHKILTLLSYFNALARTFCSVSVPLLFEELTKDLLFGRVQFETKYLASPIPATYIKKNTVWEYLQLLDTFKFKNVINKYHYGVLR